MFKPKSKSKRSSGGPLAGLKGSTSPSKPPAKDQAPIDPVKGLKMALKAAEVEQLAKQVAAASGGPLA